MIRDLSAVFRSLLPAVWSGTVALTFAACSDSRGVDIVESALNEPVTLSLDEAVDVLSISSPFEAELSLVMGLDLMATEQAVWELREESIGRCAAEMGVTISAEELHSLSPPTGPRDEGSLYSSGVQELIDKTALYESSNLVAYPEIVSDCQSEAISSISDPLQKFQAWRAEVTKDLYARMASSSAFRDAVESEAECLAEVGVTEQDRADIVSAAIDVNGEWIAGGVSLEARNQALQELLVDERHVNHLLDSCVVPRLATERVIIARFEASFIEENSAALRELGADIRRELFLMGLSRAQ